MKSDLTAVGEGQWALKFDQVWMKKCIIGLEIGSIIYVDYQVCNGNDHLMLL